MSLDTVNFAQIVELLNRVGLKDDVAGVNTLYARLAQIAGYTDQLEGFTDTLETTATAIKAKTDSMGLNTDAPATNASMWAMLKSINASATAAGGNKIAVASATQQYLDATEFIKASNTIPALNSVFMGKLIPPLIGEMLLEADLMSAGGAVAFYLLTSGPNDGSAVGIMSTAMDWRTPIGTGMSSVGGTSFGTTPTTYQTRTLRINVVKLQPIYIFASNGSDTNYGDARIKNIRLRYDVVNL